MHHRRRELVLIAVDGVIVFAAAWAVTSAALKLEWHPLYLEFPTSLQMALFASLLLVLRNLFQLARGGEVSRPGLEALRSGLSFLRAYKASAADTSRGIG